MQWLTDLLKYLSVTRPFAGALFLTSALMIFGPRRFPDLIKPIPSQWDWLAFTALIFTAAIQMIWYFPVVLRRLKALALFTFYHPRVSKLSSLEIRMLRYLSALGDRPMNLDLIVKNGSPVTKIELLVISDSLQKRGLIEENPYNSDLVSLTKSGIKLCHTFKGWDQDA